MPHQYLAIALSLVISAPSTPDPVVTVDLGLRAPVEHLGDVEAFADLLAERLVWRIEAPGGELVRPLAVHFTAVRIDRGRVTASYRSDAGAVRPGRASIAAAIGVDQFLVLPDILFTPEDPPAGVRSLSAGARLDAEGMEQMVADVARSGELGGALGLEQPMKLEWGRHVILVLAAASGDDSIAVRPLVLLLERV